MIRSLRVAMVAAVAAAVLAGSASAALISVSPPTVLFTGAPHVGMKLPGQTGTWKRAGKDAKPVFWSPSWHWLRCDARGSSCLAITGATGLTYVVRSADVGHRLRLSMTATSSAGTGTSVSDATAVVVRR